MRYRIDLCYDGADFCGWQIQPNAPSVQETLEKALSTLLREKISVVGAGRTDTGVHASYYVAHFDCGGGVSDCAQLSYKLNAILPRSVSIFSVEPAADDFHARFDAKKRTYEYYLHRRKNPFADRYSYFYGYPELDFEAMNMAAQHLLGTHDFSCFEKTGADSKTSVCTVTEAFWAPLDYYGDGARACDGGLVAAGSLPEGVGCADPTAALRLRSPHSCAVGGTSFGQRVRFANGVPADSNWTSAGGNGTCADGTASRWVFRISADRFLRNMVRATVGTLLEVGRGKRTPESVAAMLDCGATRSCAGESVPGHALFLTGIEY